MRIFQVRVVLHRTRLMVGAIHEVVRIGVSCRTKNTAQRHTRIGERVTLGKSDLPKCRRCCSGCPCCRSHRHCRRRYRPRCRRHPWSPHRRQRSCRCRPCCRYRFRCYSTRVSWRLSVRGRRMLTHRRNRCRCHRSSQSRHRCRSLSHRCVVLSIV
jgi:hypothetical protein